MPLFRERERIVLLGSAVRPVDRMTFRTIASHPLEGMARAAVPKGNADETWVIFQMIRDAAPTLGLKPKVVQTLAAMTSCLKPGRGTVCFASTRELMRRLAGVSERTIRRHIVELAAIGILERRDSPNFKRYVSRGASPADTIAFGFDLQPMIASRNRWSHALAEHNRSALERRHLKTVVKDLISRLEGENVSMEVLIEARLSVRRKLAVDDLRKLRDSLLDISPTRDAEATTSAKTDEAATPLPCPAAERAPVPPLESTASQMADAGGQNGRIQSKSDTEEKDLVGTYPPSSHRHAELRPLLGKLATACHDALSFAEKPLRTEYDVIALSRMLAPMIGIRPALQDQARTNLGPLPAAISVLLMVRIHGQVRNMEAYFRSLVCGNRRSSFEPLALLDRLSQRAEPPSEVQAAGKSIA